MIVTYDWPCEHLKCVSVFMQNYTDMYGIFCEQPGIFVIAVIRIHILSGSRSSIFWLIVYSHLDPDRNIRSGSRYGSGVWIRIPDPDPSIDPDPDPDPGSGSRIRILVMKTKNWRRFTAGNASYLQVPCRDVQGVQNRCRHLNICVPV